MSVQQLKEVLDRLIEAGYGDHSAVFSLWTANGRKDFYMRYPVGGQIIANIAAVYVGVADDCIADRADRREDDHNIFKAVGKIDRTGGAL